MQTQLPKWVIVTLVLVGASFAIFFLNPPHSACESQIDVVKDRLKGRLFPGKARKSAVPPAYIAQLENCKMGNSPGGCYELFRTMRLVHRELANLDFTCNETLGGITEVRQSLRAVMALLVQVGWGEEPPRPGEPQRSWLETSDLGLFCHMRDLYMRYYGKEELDKFMEFVFSDLPGEPPIFEGSTCANCEFRKKAKDVLSKEEMWARSLFSTRCDIYR